MRVKLFLLGFGLLIISCAAFDYKFYGVDTGVLPKEVLEEVKLIPGQKTYPRKTLADFQVDSEDELPRAILMPYSEFLEARQEILNCRQERK